jgi:hypothetical protein
MLTGLTELDVVLDAWDSMWRTVRALWSKGQHGYSASELSEKQKQ